MIRRQIALIFGTIGIMMLLTIQLVYGQILNPSINHTVENDSQPTWIKHYDFNDNDQLKEMRPTLDGGVLLMGETGEFPPGGDGFLWQMKVDATGNIVWAKESEHVETIQPTEDGGYFAEGYGFIAKYDSEGNQVWLKGLSHSMYNTVSINAIYPTDDGGIIVAGGTYDCSIGGCSSGSEWVMKLNEVGQKIWARSYDGLIGWVGVQGGGTIYETADGGYIILGEQDRIVKLAADGVVDWAKVYYGQNGSISSVQPTSDDGHLVAGSVVTATGPACWAMKLHADGSLAWEKAYRRDGFQGDLHGSLQQTADGNYALLCSEGENYSLLQLNTDGDLIDQRQYGEGIIVNYSTTLYLQLAVDGNLLVGGTITNSLGFGDQDVAVWKLKTDGTICNCPQGEAGGLGLATDLEEVIIFPIPVQAGSDPNLVISSDNPTSGLGLVGNVFTVCPTELQDEVTGLIPTEGGSLMSSDGQTQFLFPAGSFSETVQVTYRHFWDDEAVGDLAGIGHRFELTAVYSATNQPADLSPGATYTTTIHYTDNSPAIESTLGLYTWQDTSWQLEKSSQLSLPDGLLRATPDHLGQFAVLGETHRIYLTAVWQSK